MKGKNEKLLIMQSVNISDPVECFQEVCDLMNRQVPFSLSQEQTSHEHEKEDTECNKDKFIFK